MNIVRKAVTGAAVAVSALSVAHVAPANAGTSIRGWVAGDRSANVRSAPSTTARVVGHRGSHSFVSGTLVNGSWIKVPGGYINRGVIESQSTRFRTVNGRLSTSTLCPVSKQFNSPGSVGYGYTKNTQRYLNCYAIQQLNSLEAAYKKQFGHYALIDLTYRPVAEQRYWFRVFGAPRAAVPGTSNHGMAVAIDFRETDRRGEEFGWGGAGNRWLRINGGRYGFVNPFRYGTAGESYHFNFVG